MVGTSGKICERFLLVTASARTVPSRTCCMAACGNRKRPHGSFPDVLHGRLWRTEADRRVTSNNCGDRGAAAPEGNMDEVEAKRQPELFAGKMRLRAGPR